MRRALSRMLATARAQPLSSSSSLPAIYRSVLPPPTSNSLPKISPLFQATRSYSTGEQVKDADIQVPIPMFGVAGNYASALFIAATKAKKLEDVETELDRFMEAATKSPGFVNFMKDLSVPRDVRVKAMREIFGEAGFSDITKNFLAVAAEHGRLRLVAHIVERFKRLTMAYFGEVNAVVTSVIPIPAQEEQELKGALEKLFGGKNVHLQQKIDEEILGGLVIEYEDKLLDVSIRTRMRQMEDLLLDESVDFNV